MATETREACHRCGKLLARLRPHMLAVHPEEYWLKPDSPRPHETAYKMTIEDNGWTREGYAITEGEWHTAPYGMRRHGWFIPVEVPDNLRAPASPSGGEDE